MAARGATTPRGRHSGLSSRASLIVMGAMTVMVATLVLVVSLNLRTIRTAGDQMLTSTSTQLLTEGVLTAAIDQETGIRGYAESGDVSFLDPFLEGGERYEVKMAALQALAENDPRRAAQIEAARHAMTRWRARYADGVRNRPADERADPALAEVGKQEMDAFRASLGQIRAEERDVALKRADQRERAFMTAYAALFVVGGCVLAIGLGLGGFALSLIARSEAQARAHADARTRMLATVSHEIRTPLNGVLGMLQAMAAEPLSKTQSDRVGQALEAGESLTVLLNDLLDATKIEAGRFELVDANFDLDAVLRRIHGVFAPVAEAKGVQLRLEIGPDAAGFWVGDKVRLGQVLTNLVSNAVKFTQDGEVVVSAQSSAKGLLRVSVTDTGVGMDDATVENLFRPFVQATAETAHQFGGTGLGLSISRSLARLMGGDITVTSVAGRGSSFTFVAPLARGERPKEPMASHVSGIEGLRILAADDNAMNRQVLAAVLPSLGITVTLAEGGEEAISAWSSGSYDVVMLDLRMPGCDGFEVARRIRSLESAGAHTPLILLSGDVSDGIRKEGLRLGFNGFVPKPLEVQRLAAEISKVVQSPVRIAA